LGFNARDRYFHFRRTFDEGLHAFVENASRAGRTRISGYRITGPLAAVLPSFVERGGITGPETIRPDRILPEGLCSSAAAQSRPARFSR
jgi:hypothetical protein